MLLRSLAPLALVGLLSACGGQAPTPPAPSAEPAPVAPPAAEVKPADWHALSGLLHGAPEGAEVELALLVIDERGLPRDMLGILQFHGNGEPQAFQLIFNPRDFARGIRVELRGRAHLAGRLILRLPPLTIPHAADQNVGELRLVPMR
ncbi:hypothetical protein [Pseudomonas zhanjiangensis]|uniref:Lipoprotein n=1 Tax=Pseudomonas zhanjiangensis TaxID=3239015 RepID=A0ABV3YWG6_9PSED